MKKTLFLLALSLHTTNLIIGSQHNQNSQSTQSTQTDISTLSESSQFQIHASQEDAQVNDGYNYENISHLLHQPTPPYSQQTELDDDLAPQQQRRIAIVSQENNRGNTLYRAAHVYQQYNNNPRVNVVTQETDIVPQAHIVYAVVTQETNTDDEFPAQ